MINGNIRCFEITMLEVGKDYGMEINGNIRCFEIQV